jgi:hypothetical protein
VISPIRSAARLLFTAGCALACACSHAPPLAAKHQTFHYRTSATHWELGRAWNTTLVPNDSSRWANGMRLHLDHPATLRVTSSLDPIAPVAVAVFAAGKKPLAEVRAPSTLLTPPLEGDVFIVIRVGHADGPVGVRLLAALEPQRGAAQAPSPGAAKGAAAATGAQVPDDGLSPPGAGPAEQAPPSISSIPDLDLDDN